MPAEQGDDGPVKGYTRLHIRLVGKFILWTVIAAVGWSFYSTMAHDTAIAVIEQRLDFMEEKIYINQRLERIEAKIDKLSK